MENVKRIDDRLNKKTTMCRYEHQCDNSVPPVYIKLEFLSFHIKMMILYLIISSCFGDLIAFNRGVNTLQKNNFQVLGGQHLANTSPNSLRLLAELLKNNRLRTRLGSNKIKSLNSFFQNQIKKPKTNGSSFLEITATVPSKEGHNRKIGSRRKRNLLRKSFIRK